GGVPGLSGEGQAAGRGGAWAPAGVLSDQRGDARAGRVEVGDGPGLGGGVLAVADLMADGPHSGGDLVDVERVVAGVVDVPASHAALELDLRGGGGAGVHFVSFGSGLLATHTVHPRRHPRQAPSCTNLLCQQPRPWEGATCTARFRTSYSGRSGTGYGLPPPSSAIRQCSHRYPTR